MPVTSTGDDGAGAPSSDLRGSRPGQTPPTVMLETQALVGTNSTDRAPGYRRGPAAGPRRRLSPGSALMRTTRVSGPTKGT